MRCFTRICLVAAFCVAGLSAPSAQASDRQTATWQDAFAQADSAKPRPRIWTGERLKAAKKRWASNKEKFSACNTELEQKKKTQKISLHNQGDFLEGCMNRP